MSNELSVAEYILNFESASVQPPPTKTDRVHGKTKLPINKYFTKSDKQVLFIGEYMEARVSYKEVERGNTEIIGREVSTFGLFELYIWDEVPNNPESTPPNYITKYMCPTKIVTIPASISNRTVSINGGASDKAIIFAYRNKDVFIKNTTIAKLSAVVATFVDTIFGAFLSSLLKYSDYDKMIMECNKINGVSFGLTASSLNIVIAEQARYAGHIETPYRIYLNKVGGKPEPGSLKMIKVTDIPHIASTFTSFAFQDIDYAVTTSALRSRQGKKGVTSSVEEVLKY